VRAQKREYAEATKEARRPKIAAYNKARAERDPIFRLKMRMSSRLRISLTAKRVAGKAGRSWLALVDYTLEDLRKHLERQFRKGMTWENYGRVWHVDHVVPLKAFAITGTDCPEFRAAWALPNLQPLWAADNLRKNAKRLTLL
jgi:hypothetical protein